MKELIRALKLYERYYVIVIIIKILLEFLKLIVKGMYKSEMAKENEKFFFSQL